MAWDEGVDLVPVDHDPFADQIVQPPYQAPGQNSAAAKIGGNLIGGAMRGVYDMATLPGDVWTGKLDPQSDEAIDRANALALGMVGTPRGGATLGSGIAKSGKDAVSHADDIRDELTRALKRGDGHYGLRTTDSPLTVGTKAPPSRQFYDDFINENHDTFGREAFPDHDTPLAGPSVMGVRHSKDIEPALRASGVLPMEWGKKFRYSGYYPGDHVSLIRSDRRIVGHDPGEWILPDGEVVATWSIKEPFFPKKAHGGAVSDPKATKDKAHYRAGSKAKRCGLCAMFRPPHSCTAVEGVIRAGALCDYFEAKAAEGQKEAAPKIVRNFDVPWLAGSSNDNKTVFIDRRVPRMIRVKLANGKGYRMIDPAEPLAIHERSEHRAMNAGKAYEKAHIENGTADERAWVQQHGLDWGHYEEIMDGLLSHIEHEHPKRPPPTLYDRPYPHNKRLILERLEAKE